MSFRKNVGANLFATRKSMVVQVATKVAPTEKIRILDRNQNSNYLRDLSKAFEQSGDKPPPTAMYQKLVAMVVTP